MRSNTCALILVEQRNAASVNAVKAGVAACLALTACSECVNCLSKVRGKKLSRVVYIIA